MTISSGRASPSRLGRLAGASLAACLLATLAVVAPSLTLAQGPAGARFTNVTDVSFTVSWLSATAETGYVLYGASPSTVTSRADDDRGAGTSSATHHVTVTGLSAQTTYYVDFYSGASGYNNNGAHYRVATGPATPPGQPSAVYGLTARASGAPPAGILVYLILTDGDGKGSPGGAYTMSCIVKPGDQGYWVMNLGNARLADLSGPFVYSVSGDRLLLALVGGPGETLEVTLDTSAAAPATLLTVPAAAPTATATPQFPPLTSTRSPVPTLTQTPAPLPASPTATAMASASATATISPALTAAPSPTLAPTLAATATTTPAPPAGTATPNPEPTVTAVFLAPAASATPEIRPPTAVATPVAPTATPTPGAGQAAPAQTPDPLALVGGALVAVAVIGLGVVAILMRRQRG